MSAPVMPALPVVEVLPQLRAILQRGSDGILQAPPGAGKSTVVPLALLGESWLQGRRILMLEPRRLAARAVAERMASTLDEKVGQTVGYRMRLDTRVSAATRIEVITEGVLTRLLQADPALEHVGLVIFDEFHERNLHADLGLTLLLDARATLGTDLRVLVMSATLDTERVAGLLGDAPQVLARGREFPVDVRYLGDGLPAMPREGLEARVIQALRRAWAETQGDVLVFLPGVAEIRRVAAALQELPPKIRVLSLHGELALSEQDRALSPAAPGERHVVLATNIAETSLTLPGVRVVIDSGLVRRSRFDPSTGMSRLDTLRISRSSADQRAGRAGRVAPGVCYRLWSNGAERSLAAHSPAEILEADLAPLALELARWGVRDADALRWLDPPPRPMLEAAEVLLHDLDVVDATGQVTALGKILAGWPVHPRLARVLYESHQRNCVFLGASLAALLSERDPLRSPSKKNDLAAHEDIDLLSRLNILWRRDYEAQFNPSVWHRIARQAQQLQNLIESSEISGRVPSLAADTDQVPSLAVDTDRVPLSAGDAATLLAVGFPDRIALPRSESRGRYLLANGRGAILRLPDVLAGADGLIALELDDREREALIRLAVAVDLQDIARILKDKVQVTRQVFWSTREEALIAREETRLGSLVLASRRLESIDSDQRTELIIEAIRASELQTLPWCQTARQFCARIELLRRHTIRPELDWPDFSLAGLSQGLHDWLAPWLDGVTRRSHFAGIPLLQALKWYLGVERERLLRDLLPEHLTLPTGSQVPIDYLDELAPVASMRMQEVFGLQATPRIGDNRLAITFKLLSPAGRPLQITRDLASFWQNAYSEVRKDMRGRYPKHHWPEDPLLAAPTRRTKPRS